MKKVLILYNKIWPYRIPIFNLLAKKYDLTVSDSLGQVTDQKIDFKVVYLPGKQHSRFFIHDSPLNEFCKDFDVVIGYGDIGWLSLMRLLFIRNRPYKLILWGIGVRASYTSSYGEQSVWDDVRYFLMRRANALLFYSKDPIDLYLDKGFEIKRLHVANNTVLVNNLEPGVKRDILLFIGTLYKEKKIYSLLESYKAAKIQNPEIPELFIIGDGYEYGAIEKWLTVNQLDNSVTLLGKVFDETILCAYFSRGLACISPGQAGLSVLKSMGYGVPFITRKDAITGGEIFNIDNGENGVLYDEDAHLESIILDIASNKEKYLEMGIRAKKFYESYRKPEHMAEGIIGAVEFVDGPTRH